MSARPESARTPSYRTFTRSAAMRSQAPDSHTDPRSRASDADAETEGRCLGAFRVPLHGLDSSTLLARRPSENHCQRMTARDLRPAYLPPKGGALAQAL